MTEQLEGLEVARIVITRTLTLDGDDVVEVEALDGDGDQLRLVETLGLLSLSKDTAIRMAMAEDDDDGD